MTKERAKTIINDILGQETLCSGCSEDDHEYPSCSLCRMDAAEMAIKALNESRWIPVDFQNNSPEENKVVLLGVRFRDDFKYFVTSRQDYNYWTGLGREINRQELRWQPLPEPYRKEEVSE